MKRILLAGTIACTVGLLSCSKEKTVTVTNTVHDTTTLTIWPSGQINADSLTAGLKLENATAVKDSLFPAASTDAAAPKLDSLYERTYTATRGGLLTIYPATVSGYIKGYYVQIVGAKSQFKVEYTASIERKKKDAAARGQKSNARGYADGYYNGTLAFELPASLSGDTFYVKYAAYDEENRVSQPTTATVVLLKSIPNAISDSLKGTWSYAGYKYYRYGSISDSWSTDNYYFSSYSYYNCVDDKLVATTGGAYYIGYIKYQYYEKYIFSGQAVGYQDYYLRSTIDLNASSCAEQVYTLDESQNEIYTRKLVGYTYDAKSRRITLYYSDDDTNTEIYTRTYKISSLTATELILADDDNGDYGYIDFLKYTKE